jgi:hypothetical protein
VALTEDDSGLAHELRQLLARNGAEWLAEEVDAELASIDRAEVDATREAEALLVAISRTVGVIPEMLLDAKETLRSLSQGADGVLLGDNEISFATTDAELRLMAEAATVVAAPVERLLRESTTDE